MSDAVAFPIPTKEYIQKHVDELKYQALIARICKETVADDRVDARVEPTWRFDLTFPMRQKLRDRVNLLLESAGWNYVWTRDEDSGRHTLTIALDDQRFVEEQEEQGQ
jgi:hypothetical protein